MDGIKLWEIVASQGFPILLLALAVWWFNRKNDRQTEKIDHLYSRMIDENMQDKKRLYEVLEQNADSQAAIAKTLDRIADKIN